MNCERWSACIYRANKSLILRVVRLGTHCRRTNERERENGKYVKVYSDEGIKNTHTHSEKKTSLHVCRQLWLNVSTGEWQHFESCLSVSVVIYLEGFPVEAQSRHATHRNRSEYSELHSPCCRRLGWRRMQSHIKHIKSITHLIKTGSVMRNAHRYVWHDT